MSEPFSARDRRGQLETLLRNRTAGDVSAQVPAQTDSVRVPNADQGAFGNKSDNAISFGYDNPHALKMLILCSLFVFLAFLYARNPHSTNHQHFVIGISAAALCLLGSLRSLYSLLEDDSVFFLSSYGMRIVGYSEDWIPWAQISSLEMIQVRRQRFLSFRYSAQYHPVRAKRSILSFLGNFVIAKRDGVKIILTQLSCDPEQITELCTRRVVAAKSWQVGTTGFNGLDSQAPAIAKDEPTFTYVLIALLVVIYAAEVHFAVTPGRLGTLSIPTLVLSGATVGHLMSQHADWWRLFTAPLLHGSLVHLLGNCLALFFVGRVLERLVGWRWMSGIFAACALAGSLGSVCLHTAWTVGTGASGAIMGLLAALLILSFRFPKDTRRYGSQILAAQFLIPSLIPGLAGRSNLKVDYAAHGFGAVAGALIALVIVAALWPRQERQPRFSAMAVVFSAAFFLVAGASLFPIIQERNEYAQGLAARAAANGVHGSAAPKNETSSAH